MSSPEERRKAITSKLTPKRNEALRTFWAAYLPLYDEAAGAIRAEAAKIPDFAAVLRRMPEEQQLADSTASRGRIDEAITKGNWDRYINHLQSEGVQYARMGIGFPAWNQLQAALSDFLLAAFTTTIEDRQELQSVLIGLNTYLDISMTTIAEAYLEASEQVIAQQQSAILELSTPVLQVRPRLLILPLVGVIDTLRARHLTEQLLVAIRDKRARVVVMDVTGVPIVDSKVANHLVQTVEAARLMGAVVIITGLSPEIAQTLVTLGADLGNVVTLGDLQEGIIEGDRILGYKVVTTAN